MQRVITYIDGFNLYFGLRAKGWRRYMWLDLETLSRSILKANQTLTCTKYFTARISGPSAKQRRQQTYLEAVHTLPGTTVYYGKYQADGKTCRHCGRSNFMPNEKMTDVNIATHLLTDAFQDAFDTAIVVSGDSDLCPPIDMARTLFPAKRLIVAFPPRRVSKDLRNSAHGSFVIGEDKFRKSQFPQTVHKADGTSLSRPGKWNP